MGASIKCQREGGSYDTLCTVRSLGAEVSHSEFMSEAESVITSNGRMKCSQRRFAKESTKQVKTTDKHIEEKNLFKSKVYSDMKQKYKLWMQEARRREVDKAKKTKKLTID